MSIEKRENSEKEIQTPAEPQDEQNKAIDNEGAADNKDNDLDEVISQKQKQLEQLREATEEETERLRVLREERRSLGGVPEKSEPQVQPPASTDESFSEASDDVKRQGLDMFVELFPEFRPENDPGNEKFNKLDEHFRHMRYEANPMGVFKALSYIKRNFLDKESSQATEAAEVKPSIGSIDSEPSQKQNTTSALTRKLNKHEQQAARYFPGGEPEYRKELAKRENKGRPASDELL